MKSNPKNKNATSSVTVEDILESNSTFTNKFIQTHATGPKGKLPFTPEFLIDNPSGDHFGMTQNAGMGWNPKELMRKQFIILSTSIIDCICFTVSLIFLFIKTYLYSFQ